MAIERAPYGRQHPTNLRPVGARTQALNRDYRGETYGDRPAVKASHYGQLIATYFFVGGLSGAAQLLASTADLVGRDGERSVVRHGRYLALAGSVLAPIPLVADLHTPQRWYNMLRIFRRTSPMSIGAWTLTAFGLVSAAAATAQLLGDRTGLPAFRRLGRWLSVPAGLTGAIMATYTGTLLNSTSTPLWSGSERLLPALFGASATSTAAAALSLAEHFRGRPAKATRLEPLALAAGGTELCITAAADRRWRQQGVAAPIEQGRSAAAYRVGFRGLGVIAPLALYGINLLTRRRSPAVSMVAAVATLAGSYLLRSSLISAGNQSAHRPEDYFHMTQPGDGSRPFGHEGRGSS